MGRAPDGLPADGQGAWLVVLRRHLAAIAAANLAWETAQLPLYRIWAEGTAREIAFAVLHCTAGDVLIAGAALLLALLLADARAWPVRGFLRVALLATLFGVAYTMLSEWWNTAVRQSWAYAEAMPVLPIVGTGLAPLAQWIVLPPAAFWWARRAVTAPDQQPRTLR